MTGLRARLALMSAAAVAVAIVAVSALAWWATSRTMRAQVDQTLSRGPLASRVVAARVNLDVLCTKGDLLVQAGVGSMQLVRSDGSSCPVGSGPRVPVAAADVAAARGGEPTRPRDATTDTGLHVRTVTVPAGNGYALTTWRDLTELDATLTSLARGLLAAGAIGAFGALIAGWVVARAGLRPLDRLTGAAEHVAATQDLQVPIEVRGDDEVARLAHAFNRMTGALETARQRQRQMIADAGHELRTPLTSLRTNIDLLIRSADEDRPLDPADRKDLLHSVAGQLSELTRLTGELTLLSHDEPVAEPVPVRLDEVVGRAVRRAARRARHQLVTDLRPWHLVGDPAGLERAVLNLIDNAIKFSPPGSAVTVRLRSGLLEVADEGPGIPEFERPQVFQRFWRSPTARALPGSGLGLAIVADVAETHGATMAVGASPSGGASVTVRFPGHP